VALEFGGERRLGEPRDLAADRVECGFEGAGYGKQLWIMERTFGQSRIGVHSRIAVIEQHRFYEAVQPLHAYLRLDRVPAGERAQGSVQRVDILRVQRRRVTVMDEGFVLPPGRFERRGQAEFRDSRLGCLRQDSFELCNRLFAPAQPVQRRSSTAPRIHEVRRDYQRLIEVIERLGGVPEPL
jgi:hypothetical protein